MSDLRPAMGVRPVLTAVTLVCFGLLGSVALVSSQTPESTLADDEQPQFIEVADRDVKLRATDDKPATDDNAATTRDMEAGALAKREAGKVGSKDARVYEAQPGSSILAAESGNIGGVIGAKGIQIRSGGLGSRGSGLGGGGQSGGLGGLGVKGVGSGRSGYGSGAGSLRDGSARSSRQARMSAVQLSPPAPPAAASQREHPPGEAVFAATLEPGKRRFRSPLTNTAVDATSTFAADVDTGSYTYARRLLRSSQLPKPESVRVEEFINFFRYDYAQPKESEIMGVTSELVAHPDTPGHHLLTIGVQAKTVADADRKPVRLTFLVDTSGSMRGRDRLGLAQRAMKHALLGLGDEDTVAIVTYSGSTHVALAPTPATRRGEIRAAIDRLVSRGGTAMDSGMALAYQQAEASYAEGAENRVIVLSDGDANIGRTDADDMLQTIRKHAEGGITLTTMGFGTGNYKDARMEQLADAGDGAYVYIDGWSEAERVFGEQLGATLETVGRDVKLQLELDPARVKSWRQVGYVNRQIDDDDFRDDSVDAGEVGSGHQVTALYELELRPGVRSVGDLHLRIKPPGPDRPAKEWRTTLTQSQSRRPSADTRTAVAAMHLADGLHDRDADSLRRARDEAEALQAAGRKGAVELAELSRLALRLLTQTDDPVATR